MQAKSLAGIVGTILTIFGLGWWAFYYISAADRLGVSTGEFLQETAVCAIYTTDFCAGLGVVAGFFGFSVYQPFVLWAGIVCLIVALVWPRGRAS